MDTDSKVRIIELVENNGPISSSTISQTLDLAKIEVFRFLKRCEKRHIVKRSGGVDPDNTIVFQWTLLTDKTGDLSAI